MGLNLGEQRPHSRLFADAPKLVSPSFVAVQVGVNLGQPGYAEVIDRETRDIDIQVRKPVRLTIPTSLGRRHATSMLCTRQGSTGAGGAAVEQAA